MKLFSNAVRGTAIAGLVVLSLAAVAGPQGPARGAGEVFSWRDAAGRPSMRDQAGIFIWHEGNTFFVTSQSEHHKTTDVHAMLRGGRIVNVSRLHDERGDSISQRRDNEVNFKSQTWDGRDEMRFDVVNGDALTVTVRQPHERNRPIYVGGSEMRANGERITIRIVDRR